MNLTQKISILTLSSLLIVASASAQATTTTPVFSKKTVATVLEIKTKGDEAIADRITSLNKAIAKLTKYKHLSADMLAQITASLGTGVSEMNAAKVKLDADTDLATAKADYQAIFKDNRIYAVVLPQQDTMATMDNLLGQAAKLKTTLTTLGTRADAKATAGKDVVAIRASLTDASAKLDEVTTQVQNALSSVASLKVDHGDKTIQASNKQITDGLKTIRSTIKSDLKTISADIASARAGLKAIK